MNQSLGYTLDSRFMNIDKITNFKKQYKLKMQLNDHKVDA